MAQSAQGAVNTPKKPDPTPQGNKNTEPKFGMIETLLGFLAALTIDIISGLVDVPTVGIGGFFIQALTWLIFRFWFTIKGVKVTASLARGFVVPMLVQLVPVIPTEAATFLVTVYMENHPEKFAIIEKVAGAAEGRVPAPATK